MPGLLLDRLARHRHWAALLAVMALVTAVRLRLLDVPLERDEGEYAYMAQLLLDGSPPYEGAYNMKLPGTAAAYAVSMAVAGQTVEGARAGLVFANLATTVLVFLLGRVLLGAGGGLAAGTAYAFFSLSPGFFGIFGHATHFVALFGTAGLLVFAGALARPGALRFLGAGSLLGLAFLMKQPGGVFLGFAVVWLAWDRLRGTGPSLRRLASEEGMLLAGAALPVAICVAIVASGGQLGRFWFWVVDYGRAYGGVIPLDQAPRRLFAALVRVVPPNALLWALAAAGTIAAGLRAAAVPKRGFLLALLASSALGVCPGFYFRPHYFILALPAVSLMVGAAVVAAARLRAAAARRAVAALVVLACAQSAWASREVLFELSPAQVSRALYSRNPFPEAIEVARYVAERTRPEDRIAVLGSEPELLFYAKRRSATGYVYVYSLMEPQPYALQMQEEMIAEIERGVPAYVVLVGTTTSWMVTARSERRLIEWMETYLAANYEIVGSVAILGPEITEYAWGDAATATGDVLVFRRKGFVSP